MSDESANRENPDDSGPNLEPIRQRYQRFAEFEAREVSPLYEELAQSVANSEPLLQFIASLPPPKQQPNLVFAAVRHLFGTPKDGDHFLQFVQAQPEQTRDLILKRSTQTNEPARCATLLPVLAQLPQPLALIEVGASAGLCLLLDRYGYDYGKAQLRPANLSAKEAAMAPVFPCSVNEATPIPGAIPQVIFRAGLDLNPIDVSDPHEVAWLETLVWPGQEPRAQRLHAAIQVAQQHPVPLVKGDLLTDLPTLVSTAPKNATLVVFHSAVLAYVAGKDRERFVDLVRDQGCVWISNEGPDIFPQITAKMRKPAPQNRFVLAVDGEPVAITGPHGQSIEWLD